MIEELLSQASDTSDLKRYRQVKIVQEVNDQKTSFVVDIADDEDGVEKMDELFETIYKHMQKIEFYEENR